MLEAGGGHTIIELFHSCIPLNFIQTMKENNVEVGPC